VPWAAPRDGVVAAMDAELVGRAAVALGAGRDRADAAVDQRVGNDNDAPVGTAVRTGDAVVTIACDTPSRVEAARRLLDQAIVIGDTAPTPPPIVLETITI
jgi:thymidine phosphorylase